MKKNLILLTSLIPLGISTVPFVTSCGPTITSDSIEWDFNVHGAYNSRVAARTFSDRVTLGQATNIYLQDLKQNPYIFIDDFMVSIDTVIYYAKQLNLTLKQGKVNLNFNISSDNYVSFELKLNINLYQGDKPFFTLDTDFEVQNIAYVISYYVSDPIPPIISAFSRWSFLPYIESMGSIYEEFSPYVPYFAKQTKQWFIKGNITQWNEETGRWSMDFDANNNNYQTVDFGGLFADPLFKIANSKYMSNAKIKEDYVLDALEGEYIKCKTDLNIDTTKQYIVKIDMSSWDKDPSSMLRLRASTDNEADYLDKIESPAGLDFAVVEGKRIIPETWHGSSPHEINTGFSGLAKDDIIYTNITLSPKQWGTTIDGVELKASFN